MKLIQNTTESSICYNTEGEPIDITDVWEQVKLEYIKSLEVGNEHD